MQNHRACSYSSLRDDVSPIEEQRTRREQEMRRIEEQRTRREQGRLVWIWLATRPVTIVTAAIRQPIKLPAMCVGEVMTLSTHRLR